MFPKNDGKHVDAQSEDPNIDNPCAQSHIPRNNRDELEVLTLYAHVAGVRQNRHIQRLENDYSQEKDHIVVHKGTDY